MPVMVIEASSYNNWQFLSIYDTMLNHMTEKKKILYIITKGNFGGAQRYVYDLATGLPKEEFEPVVACGEGETLPSLLQEKGVRVFKISKLAREVKIFDEFRVCKELTGLIRRERPDIIHLNSSKIGGIGAVAGRLASWLEKNYHPKIIFTAHNWGFNDIGRSFLQRAFYFVSHLVTLTLCHKTIAVSYKTKKDARCMPFVGKKIEVIYNGISKFDPAPKEEARQFLAGEYAEKTVILSISELHKNKGLGTALKALSLLPEKAKEKIVWCVAGDGEEKEKLAAQAKKLGLANSVRFLGFVPEAKKYLSGADIFLLPSHNEAFPYAVLEAGLSGKTIIATAIGGVPEVIKDMQNGILVHPKNPKEIAEAVVYLLDHKDKQKEFGSEIKKTVSDFFSLEKMLRETMDLYNKLT